MQILYCTLRQKKTCTLRSLALAKKSCNNINNTAARKFPDYVISCDYGEICIFPLNSFLVNVRKSAETAHHKCFYKRCSENIHQLYRKTRVAKCD